ncbi:unnamed protein product [Pedinophyceae sp. YPF-701]|nr:unnamed protein product [Pedinophyceae sp. YPF-701]
MGNARAVQALQEAGHALLPLGEAYRRKMGQLQDTINQELLVKRDALLHQAARVEARAEEVRSARGRVEREVRARAEDALARLDAIDRVKQAMLGRDRDELARQLDDIRAFVSEAVEASRMLDQLQFLASAPSLLSHCKHLSSRDHPMTEPVSLDGLDATSVLGPRPEEAAVMSADEELREKYDSLHKLVAIKDAMIWQLLDERATLRDEMRALTEKMKAELGAMEDECLKWRKLAGRRSGGGGGGGGVGGGGDGAVGRGARRRTVETESDSDGAFEERRARRAAPRRGESRGGGHGVSGLTEAVANAGVTGGGGGGARRRKEATWSDSDGELRIGGARRARLHRGQDLERTP